MTGDLIELLVIHDNTWNHLAVYKRMSNIEWNY